MSASRDPRQSSTYIPLNLYELYLREKNQSPASHPILGQVLKTRSPRCIEPSESAQLSAWSENSEDSKKSLARTLNDLRHARKKLNFMIAEMDELIKKTS